jgi:hypothetical protein
LHVDLLHPLPLREVEWLQQDADNRLKLVGGSSLRQVDWDYEAFAVVCNLRSFQTAWSMTRRSK